MLREKSRMYWSWGFYFLIFLMVLYYVYYLFFCYFLLFWRKFVIFFKIVYYKGFNYVRMIFE